MLSPIKFIRHLQPGILVELLLTQIKRFMDRKSSSILYGILGIYTILISWYYNHSIILAIIHYIFWPVYLIYEVLIGHLANGMWKTIPQSYFN